MTNVQPGSVIAGYRIESIVARGGMGVVYRATQLALDRPVALKVIAPEAAGDASFRERFQRESRLAASIDHPNVIPVHEAGEHDGELYITMRLVDGIDLGRLIAQERKLTPGRTSAITTQIAAALDAAHSRGLVHRDVKPANVLVTSDDHVYLTDFGLVKSVSSDSGPTQTGQVVGTVNYVAPEQIHGRGSDARADIYALGCVVYQMLTGELPFARDTPVATMWAHSSDPPPALALADPSMAGIDAVIARSLAKDPDDRYQSAGDMARAFAAAVSGKPVAAPERSVARGEAAPDGDTPQTVIEGPSGPTRALEGDAPTAGLTAPTAPGGPTEAQTASGQPTVGGGGERGGRRALLIAGGVLGVIALLVVLVTLLGGGEDEPTSALDAKSFSTSTTKPTQTPGRVAVGEGGVWVTDSGRGVVQRVNQSSGEREGDPIAVGEGPDAIEAGEGYVWVLVEQTLKRIDPGENQVTGNPIEFDFGTDDIEVGEGAVWVSDTTNDLVIRIDPEQNKEVARIEVPAGVGNISIGEGYVWVAGDSVDPALTRIDTETNKIAQPGNVTLDSDVVAGYGYGWGFTGDTSALKLTRIDPATGNAVGSGVAVENTGSLEVGAGAVWLFSNGRITLYDPETGKRAGSGTAVSIESESGIAVGDAAAWVTQPTEGALTRVGF